jgi:acyl carrier protein
VPDRHGEILAEIRRIFADELERTGPVEPTHELARDLGVDSVGAIVLAVGLEDRFRVKLADDDASAIVTVADLVGLVERGLREQEDVSSASVAEAESGA